MTSPSALRSVKRLVVNSATDDLRPHKTAQRHAPTCHSVAYPSYHRLRTRRKRATRRNFVTAHPVICVRRLRTSPRPAGKISEIAASFPRARGPSSAFPDDGRTRPSRKSNRRSLPDDSELSRRLASINNQCAARLPNRSRESVRQRHTIVPGHSRHWLVRGRIWREV